MLKFLTELRWLYFKLNPMYAPVYVGEDADNLELVFYNKRCNTLHRKF